MPILTPAYPSMNSSFNVSTHTLAVMKDELKRALGIVQDILNKGGADWSQLFEPSDFFAVHQHYLAVDVYTATADEEQAWCGFCESRIRKLVESLAYIPQLCRIRTFTKKYPLAFVEAHAPVPPASSAPDVPDAPNAPGVQASPATPEPIRFGVCYFVGFDIDRRQLRGREVSIDNSVDYFKHNDLYRWNKRTPTMDVKITPVVWKNLPECVFEDMGGRSAARIARREFMKKKKEEEKAPGDAMPTATATSASSSEEASVKDLPSQDTDGGTGEEDNASATDDASSAEENAAPEAGNGKLATQALVPGSQSPNPATDGSEESTAGAPAASEKPEFSTPVKVKKEVAMVTPNGVGASPHVIPGKRSLDNGSASVTATPVGKAPPSVGSSGSGTPLIVPVPAASAAPKLMDQVPPVPRAVPTIVAPPPAPVSSPRKRRKMKITFGKLN